MGLEVLNAPEQVIRVARRELGVGPCPSSATRFEILRATVWSMATPKGKAHVNRVLGAALAPWSLLSERAGARTEDLRVELREALATLEDSGDLIELHGGFWAPATARLVKLNDGASCLLVGGVPSSLLQIGDDAIQFHGPHRHLTSPPLELASTIPTESLATWARLPSGSLQNWARQVIESTVRQPYLPTTEDAFEFYLPANSRRGAPQFHRWFENSAQVTGTLLARRRRLYGAQEYRLVDVLVGQIVGAAELHHVDVRRLMYALDLAAGNPVHARPIRMGTQTEWLFTSELPRAEQRTFAALGFLQVSEDRRFERRWTFVRNENLALEMLSSLGIALDRPPGQE